MSRIARRGMLLGKFLPPHRGHVYMTDFAAGLVEELDVVVCSLPCEPIPGPLRHRWMQELAPRATVHHLTEDLPQEPAEHPDFWRLWEDALRRLLPVEPELVFASEAYGSPLAELFGARFVPVDPEREIMPISGTAVRARPLTHWRLLPAPVRPYFLKRVCVFGPESTGKTTLTRELAEAFETVAVPEYARTWLEAHGRDPEPADMPMIAAGRLASQQALERRANRVLICDTDALTTRIWSEELFGEVAPEVAALVGRETFDLTLLTDIDVPFEPDPIRYFPNRRERFMTRCREALEEAGRRYTVIRGSREERRREARRAVESLLADSAE